MILEYTDIELSQIESMCGEFKHPDLKTVKLWRFDGEHLSYTSKYHSNKYMKPIKITERTHFDSVLIDWTTEVKTGRNRWTFTPHPEWFIYPEQTGGVWRWLSE